MKAPRWEGLATRARGLATHLLHRHNIVALAAAEGIRAVAVALRGHGYPLPEGDVTAADLELAVRRQAGARLVVLARWAGPHNALLAVIFEDEDRRSVRAIVRGAIQGTSADLRLAGLVPTPGLPERVLRELATRPSLGAVAVLLTAWGNAYGTALLRQAKAAQPDLFAIESGLNATFTQRVLRAAYDTRSHVVIDHVRETIDVENALAALVLAGVESDTPARQAFMEGGKRLQRPAFLEAVATRDAVAAGRRLAAAIQPVAVARVFERTGDPALVEEALLRSRIAVLRDAERRDPAGPAAVLRFALRVRAEVIELRRVIWGVVLGAPQESLVAG